MAREKVLIANVRLRFCICNNSLVAAAAAAAAAVVGGVAVVSGSSFIDRPTQDGGRATLAMVIHDDVAVGAHTNDT